MIVLSAVECSSGVESGEEDVIVAIVVDFNEFGVILVWT